MKRHPVEHKITEVTMASPPHFKEGPSSVVVGPDEGLRLGLVLTVRDVHLKVGSLPGESTYMHKDNDCNDRYMEINVYSILAGNV